MRKIVSIGLIFLMSIQGFYKLGVITYFQMNRAFIAEFLCINKEQPVRTCQGKCFLRKNLNMADDAPQSTTPATKEKIEIPFFVLDDNTFATLQVGIRRATMNTNYLFVASPVYLASPFRPPASV